MRNNLAYRITQQTTTMEGMEEVKTEMREQLEETPNIDAITGLPVLKQLFNEEDLDELGILSTARKASDEDNRLISQPIRESMLKSRIANVEALMYSISHGDTHDLRNAFFPDRASVNLPLVTDVNEATSEHEMPIAHHADKLFYLYNDDKGSIRFLFDYLLLYRLLFAPTLTTEEMINNDTETNYTITINKEHLVAFLSLIFSEGFVLSVENEGAAGRPIVFNTKRGQPKPNLYSLVLDCSGSMSSGFSSYIDKVKSLVQKLHDECHSNAKLRIIPFNNKLLAQREFDLSQNNLSAIFNYLNSLNAAGHTFLTGTVNQELKSLEKSLDEYNTTMILFTDGDDNVKSNESKCSLRETIQNTPQPPKIYTFGLGSSYNREMISELADITGCVHTHLTNVSQFQILEEHMQAIDSARELVTFIQGMTRLIVPAKEGTITVAKDTIRIPVSLRVGNSEYTVENQSPRISSAPHSTHFSSSSSKNTPAPQQNTTNRFK
ncbi:MAG: VWA domain-containing protein [Gammaproteobacteria bacterium]